MPNPYDQFDEKKNTFDSFGYKPQATSEERVPEPVPTDLDFDMERRPVPSLRPLGEFAAASGTGIAGNVAAGLVGLGTLAATRDLNKARGDIEKVQEALIYKPKTDAGKELLDLASLPYEETLGKLSEKAGGYIESKGYPNLAATVDTAIKAGPLLFQLARMGGKPVLTKLDNEIQSTVTKGIEKSIRPAVQGKKTASQMNQYMERAKTAVTEIVDNKDNLVLTNEYGEVLKGQLPKSLKQFSQAIEQTRQNIYSQYNALDMQANRAGATVKLSNIADELENIAKSKVVIDHHPEVAKYALDRAEKLRSRKEYTAIEAQDVIASLNSKLESFYKNPSFENTKIAHVDAMIANNIRKSLDSAIENATGKEYQPLKNKYGALKEIERDVSRRAMVDARKNPKGLIDFSDIFSGYNVINGIVRFDPASIAAGVGAKSIASYVKWINDPNRIVRNLFKDTEQLIEKRRGLTP